jgi:hypothetical protein
LDDGRLVALMPERFVHYSQVFLAYDEENLVQKPAVRALVDRTKSERVELAELSVGA